jgi:hypothetical protein
VLMGTATLWIATARSAMPSPGGWSGALSARLQHYGHVIAQASAWIPGWAALLAIALALVLLIRRGLHEVRGPNEHGPIDEAQDMKEGSHEQQDR